MSREVNSGQGWSGFEMHVDKDELLKTRVKEGKKGRKEKYMKGSVCVRVCVTRES